MTDYAHPLVGREEELEVLLGLLDQAKGGPARFAQVTGEPGIGKTYLLAELGRRADADGWLVLSGRSTELEQELPFGLVVDTFDSYLASLDPQTFERIALDELEELAGIFPALRSLAPEPEEPTTPSERFRAHRAVVEMIERLAARQPVLMILDDLHWADGASVEQVGYVFRRPPEGAVMVVGSLRTGQGDPALAAAVAGGLRDGYVELLELGPLDLDDAGKLVNSGRVAAAYEASGGNPFYLLQLVRSRRSVQAAPAASAGTDGEIPAAVAAAIRAELDALSPTARALGDAAAVAGDPFEIDLAIETAGVEEPDALVAIDELIERDLIRPAAVPRAFQFRHPLVRSAVYEAAAPGARLAAHRRALRSLAERGAPATERAHHVLHAGRPGDTEAVAILQEAGEAALGRAPSSAVRWLEAALRLMPTATPRRERLVTLTALARAQSATGQFEAGRDSLLQAIELTPEDEALTQPKLISACAALEQLLGRRDVAEQRLASALERVDPGSAEAASLMIDLAVCASHSTDYEAMRTWAERAVALTDDLEEPVLQGSATAVLAWARGAEVGLEQAEADLDRAASILDRLTDEQVAKRVDSLGYLAGAEFLLSRYGAAEAHARRGISIARATGQDGLFPMLTQGLANALYSTGRLADAAEVLESAAESARMSGNVQALWWALLSRGHVALFAGDLEAAQRFIEEGGAVGRAAGEPVIGVWSGTMLGAVLVEAGDSERAERLLTESTGGEGMPAMPAGWRAHWLEYLTRARLATGDVAGALRTARNARAVADATGLPLARLGADRAEADVALAAGEPDRAADLALSSAAVARELGCRLDEAFARTLAGEAFMSVGDSERAIEELQTAAGLFDDCHAARYRARAEKLLGKLGKRAHRRSRPGTGDGIGSLTGRELEVARLVADRRTNPEIAAELFLSVKTVETHMRNIFGKLGVGSRVEVARVVEAGGDG
jgi:ATP/maltotriose-dependent transcriptional regulator MalT